METRQSVPPERTDRLLSALANQHCRFVLSYFGNTSEEYAAVDDLATALARRDPEDENRAAKHLHHIALPKLADAGLVDYDARTKTVRYRGHPRLEKVREYVSESEWELAGSGNE